MLRRTFLQTSAIALIPTRQTNLPELTPAEHFLLLDPLALVVTKSRRRWGLRAWAARLHTESREVLLNTLCAEVQKPGFFIQTHPAFYAIGGTVDGIPRWRVMSERPSLREPYEGEIRPYALRAWVASTTAPSIVPLYPEKFWCDRLYALEDALRTRKIRFFRQSEGLGMLRDSRLALEDVQELVGQHFPLGWCEDHRIEVVRSSRPDYCCEIRMFRA